MIVIVREHTVELKEPQDLGRLRVFSTCTPAAIDDTLRSAGLGQRSGGGHVLLATTALHARAVQEPEVGTDADWERRWIGMVRQALAQGWAHDHGGGLVVRIESD